MRKRVQKSHSAANGKGGFTLVELSIVLALVVILVATMVSFSVLMSGYAQDDKAEYDFLEDAAALKDSLVKWISENDKAGCEFTVYGNYVEDKGESENEGESSKTKFVGENLSVLLPEEDGKRTLLTVGFKVDSGELAVMSNSGTPDDTDDDATTTLRAGLMGVHVCNFSLDSAKVDGEVVNGSQRIIKCTLTAIDNDGQAMTVSFVVALRAATVIAQEEAS